VMLELHSLGQNADRGLEPVRETSYREQKLMLLCLNAGSASGVLAETQEATNLIAQFCHCFEVGDLGCLRHIISGYDMIV